MNHGGPAERELLLGILALQNSFVTQEQLLTGFREWTTDKSCGLADVLVHNGALNEAIKPALESLVTAHIQTHQNSAELSLAAMPSLDHDLSDQLMQINDPDLQESISGIHGIAYSPQPMNSELSLTLAMGRNTEGCGRFRILRPHRRGGLGEVFVAKDEVAVEELLTLTHLALEDGAQVRGVADDVGRHEEQEVGLLRLLTGATEERAEQRPPVTDQGFEDLRRPRQDVLWHFQRLYGDFPEQQKQHAEQARVAARQPGDALEQQLNEQLPRYQALRRAAGFE